MRNTLNKKFAELPIRYKLSSSDRDTDERMDETRLIQTLFLRMETH